MPRGPVRGIRVWKRAGLVGALLAAMATASASWLLRDPVPRINARRSELVSAVVHSDESSNGHRTRSVRLRARSGLAVELLMRQPDNEDSATHGLPEPGQTSPSWRPLFLILGGHRTGERAATLVGNTRGAIVAALAYPYDGPLNPKGWAVVPLVPAIRKALLDTPAAILLALDYLLGLPDVDPARVELVGASFGAPFAAVATALDPRVSRLWIVHGAGRPYTLLNYNLRRSVPFGPLRAMVAGLANVLASGPRLAPERWVPHVAPRPVIMINAEHDERLPREAIDALFRHVREPKEIIWLPGQHVQSNREDVIRGLVETVLSRAQRP